ncbi:MAG: hypothetical protein ACYC77_06340 [Coriobacteriia bacterium]
MEFSLICPQDGRVELSLEDIYSVVFRDPESCDIFFSCPKCGDTLKASVRSPNMLMAALELARLAEVDEGGDRDDCDDRGDRDDRDDRFPLPHVRFEMADAGERGIEESPVERVERERVEESYCEYFRRQLSRVECVEDLLAETEGS